MKKIDWALLISVTMYSFLFYKQSAGINFFIFNLTLVSMLIFIQPQLIKNKVWLSVAICALLSSFFIFIYGSALAITANVFSLFILSAISINTATSFLTGIFLTVCAIASSCVFMFIDWANKKKQQLTEQYHRPLYVKIFLLLIPFLIVIVFFLLYQSSNPLFYELTKEIDLSFISIGWMFFTLGGLLLLYGFFYNRILPGVASRDANSSLTLTPEIAAQKGFLKGGMNIDTKNSSGVILLCMLNILLLLVNCLDINYFLFNGKLPEGVDHKAFVHDGIGTLITSIVIAISIILFYFSGELNFYKKSRWLKIMAFIWIAQNVFMVFSTAYRNGLYISESGLSYKKIGVYVYLLLTFIGLATTFIKVWKLRTNWYLFRVNSAVYFYLLVFSCVFNWDVIITDFNIKKHDVENKKLEKYFLLDLSYKNLPQLISLPDSVASVDDMKARDYYNESRGTYYTTFKTGLSGKLYSFMNDYYQLKWQSECIEKNRVYKALIARKDEITELNLEGYYHYLRTLKPLEKFDNIRTLNLSGNNLKDVRELTMFRKLDTLYLNYNRLDSVFYFPVMPRLTVLYLKSCGLDKIDFLSKQVALRELDLSGNYIMDYSPLYNLKNLRKVTIERVPPKVFEELKLALPDTDIIISETNLGSR